MVQISALVVAAHSYGGLIADLLARTHPGMVSGLVLVDPTSQFLPTVGNAAPNTDSGHNIVLYQPQLVAGQILATVNRVREG